MEIGVLRLSSMGDVVLLTPFLRNLRESFPEANITLLTEEKYHSLFRCDKRVNDVTDIIPEKIFDIFFDLHRTKKSSRIIKKTQAERFFNINKEDLKRVTMVLTKIRLKIPHVTERYSRVLSELGIKYKKYLPEIHLCEEDKIKAKKILKAFKRPFIALFPGAGRRSREWPFYSVLAAKIDRGSVFLFGDKDDKKRFSSIPSSGGFWGADLGLVSALIAEMDVSIGGDTGLTHISYSVGTNTIQIYGSSIPESGFYPLGNSVYISKNLPCKPCSLHGVNFCPFGYACLRSIGVNEVYKKLRAFL